MAPPRGSKRRSLRVAGHEVFDLDTDLLLVFKPREHAEDTHAHAYSQRLRVLRGELEVRVGRRRLTLTIESQPYVLRAGRKHATLALQDTWLVAERLGGGARSR